MSATLVFLDTETTGLDPDRHEVYEIGLIVRHPDADTDQEYRWWLRVNLDRADPNALRIGRYFQRHPDRHNLRLTRQWWPNQNTGVLEDGKALSPQPVSMQDIAERLMRLTADAHLVGAVPSFDAAFLTRFLRAHGCCPAWHYHLVDVEALAAGYLNGVGSTGVYAPGAAEPPWNSNELSRAVGAEPDQVERHTALGDARWARAIYDAVMGGGAR